MFYVYGILICQSSDETFAISFVRPYIDKLNSIIRSVGYVKLIIAAELLHNINVKSLRIQTPSLNVHGPTFQMNNGCIGVLKLKYATINL